MPGLLWRFPRLTVLAVIVLILALILLVIWVSFDLVTRRALNRVAAQGWPTSDGSLDSFPARFPERTVNGTARDLERLSRSMGIDLVCFDDNKGSKLDNRESREWKALEPALTKYVNAQLATPTPEVGPPAAEVSTYLESNAVAIRDIAARLRAQPPPEWYVRLDRGFDEPIPQLLGHLHLFRVLAAQALAAWAAGRADEAWTTLESAGRLSASLYGRSDMVSLLIALAETKAMAGVLRKLPAPIPAWAPEWPPVDLRVAFLSGYTGDVWRLRTLASLSPGSDTFAAIDNAKPSLLGRTVTTVFAPFTRHYVTNVVEIERESLHRLEARVDCTPEPILPPDSELLPEWNTPGKSFMMTNAWDSSWRRLSLTLAHLQGTRLIIAAKAARARDGKWPAAALSVRDPCPAPAWAYEVDGAGVACFRTTRNLDPVWKGETLVLPLEYCERGHVAAMAGAEGTRGHLPRNMSRER